MNINYKAYNVLKNLIYLELKSVPNKVKGSEVVQKSKFKGTKSY
jgi:hypothetical protein